MGGSFMVRGPQAGRGLWDLSRYRQNSQNLTMLVTIPGTLGTCGMGGADPDPCGSWCRQGGFIGLIGVN